MNRVIGGDVSKIFGQLSANGRVIIVNPAGIYFGATAHINVNSLIATTANIQNADFLAGNYKFVQAPDKATTVINEGEIHAAEGLVALVAPAVANSGVIEANLGRVVLASGNEFTVDLYGDQMINFAVNNKVTQTPVDQNNNPVQDAVANRGTIIADGGKILMTANVAQNVVQNVINMEGVAQARSVIQKNGEIILSGGDTGVVKVAGRLDVSGKTAGSKGGTVKVLGEKIQLTNAKIDASGDAGGGTALIGGNYQGKGPEFNATTTVVDADTEINASAINSGDGGKVVIWSNDYTDFGGKITAKGGLISGNGGITEVSGKAVLAFHGAVDVTAANGNTGSLLLDPHDITIQTSGPTTGGMYDTYTSAADSSIVTITDLLSALNSANVTIQTGSGGTQFGDITIANDFTVTSANTLTLSANRNIVINGAITSNTAGATLNL